MSELRDRVKAHIHSVLLAHRFVCTASFGYEVANEILEIPELAIVDREAVLPQCGGTYEDAQKDMLKANYVKEVK